MLTELFGVPFLDHFDFLKDQNRISEAKRIIQFMGYKNDRSSHFMEKILELKNKLLLLDPVQMTERLIQ
jgi:hypothetical protein